MNEIIDFLTKENTETQKPKLLFKKEKPLIKDLTKKIEIAKKQEEKFQIEKQLHSNIKIKPLKELKKKKKEIVWL